MREGFKPMIMSMCWDKLGGQTSKTQTLLDVQGDSGGSVMHLKGKNYESIGIVSWGVEGCQVHPKSAFHRIHNHGSKYPLFLKSPISTINNQSWPVTRSQELRQWCTEWPQACRGSSKALKVLLIMNIVFNSIEGSGLCPREADPVRHCVTVAGKWNAGLLCSNIF